MQGKSILVTGGCGFIGATLVPGLVSQGNQVRVLDNFSTGSRDLLNRVNVVLIEGDIRDPEALDAALAGVDTVIHLAAFGSVVDSVDNPEANFDVNVLGTFRLLEACRKHGIQDFIFASTGGALIGDALPPVDERSLPKPISPYGASKLCGEAYCHAFARSFGIRTVSLRFANVYGPWSAHKRGVITRFIKAILKNEPLEIYGDGSASRDFLYVEDLCEGIVKAMNADLPGGTVLHLASGVETRISELAQLIMEIAGVLNHPIRYEPARRGEVNRNFARFDRAQALIAFQPTCDLRTGLERTWEWFYRHRSQVLDVAESDA